MYFQTCFPSEALSVWKTIAMPFQAVAWLNSAV